MKDRFKNLFKMHKYKIDLTYHNGHQMSVNRVPPGKVKFETDLALNELALSGKVGDDVVIKIVKVK